MSLGLAAGTGAYQIFKGLRQAKEARKLKQQDLTPEAFKEELAASRLAANNQRLPGEGAVVDRINTGFTNGVNNSIQAGTGSAGILATLGRLDQNRNNAFLGLGQQAAQFQQGQQSRLSGNLRLAGNYQTQSREAYEREKAALKEASSRNIFGGVSTIAGAGITGLTGGFKEQKNQNDFLSRDTSSVDAATPNVINIDQYQNNRQNSPLQLPGYGLNSFSEYGKRKANAPFIY